MILDHGLHILYNLEERTQDCFKQAAARLREGCRSLLVSNHDKMAYALELTLCEVATAKIAIPTVCAQFTELDKHERPSDYNNIVQQCITLLAAVPQTWTSYSGYYRDAEAMCLAVRYPIERERLEQLHQNVTRYQIKQLSMLQQQQKYMAAWRHEEGTRLTQLRTLQDRLWQHMQRSFEDANQQQSEHLEALSTAIVKLKEESEAALLTNQHQWELYTQAGQQHWNSLWDFAYETLTKGIDQLDTRLREVLNASDKLLMQQYEAEAGWETVKDAQTRVVHDWDQTWTHVNTSLITMLQITAQEIQQLQLQVHDVREQIFTLVQSVQRASRRLMSIMSKLNIRMIE
ncbi:hypothetical protein BCR43DRAFT_565709 [Syncephalastrum racemosum]|uniref:Karyogamy protein n=1 Tax=Syncephalastrum racemosum TaxID=13706 RepID=A0A1X2H3S6_SYNRA|nr:hypothetical protein BCR43DRAFT_565709 [Syncephalastrum racemosum]